MISTAQDEYRAAREAWLDTRRRPQILRTVLHQSDRWLDRLEDYNLREMALPADAQANLYRFLADAGVEVRLSGSVNQALDAVFHLQQQVLRLLGHLPPADEELEEDEIA